MYKIASSALKFDAPPIELSPALSINWLYIAKLENDKALPSGLITFDTTKLEFSVQSNDPSFTGDHIIVVEATSDDPLTQGQVFTAQFTLTVEASIVNNPPKFDNLGSTSESFTFSQSLNTTNI